MRNRRLVLLIAVVMTAIACAWCQGEEVQAGSLSTRGVWVSCFEFEKLGLKNKTESQFRANANRIFANIKASG